MEKRLFFKIIRNSMISNGFDKTGRYDFSKFSLDGTLRIVVRIPDGKSGFIIGVQFPDYGAYTGTLSECFLRNYDFEIMLVFPDVREYSRDDILTSIDVVIDKINPYIQYGKEQIKKDIDGWAFYGLNDRDINDVLEYLNLPTVDLYSEDYMMNNIAQLKRGGFLLLSMSEYTSHKDYYDRFSEHNCYIDVDIKRGNVMIGLLSYL